MDDIKSKVQFVANLYKSKKLFEAEKEAKKLLRENPNIVFVYNILGLVLAELKKFDEAISCFERGLKINPENIDNALIYNNLGSIYFHRDNFFEAELCFKKSLEVNVKNLEAMNNLGNLYIKLSNYKDGIDRYKKAISINPNFFPSHYNLGIANKNIGNFDEAKIHLEKTINIKKDFFSAHRSLSEIIKYEKDNNHLKVLNEIYYNNKIPKEKKIEIVFSLAKANNDLKDFGKAFQYYKEANDLRKKQVIFSKEEVEYEFNSIKKIFNKDFVNKMNIKNSDSSIIFIIGMPRSGTTLVEQILSSHSEVYGGDELNTLPELIEKNFPQINNFSNTSGEDLAIIFHEYLSHLKKISKNSKVITDKLPINFKWIGLIKSIYPNCKVINCKRNSKDTCFSIFKNYFTNRKLNFAYNLNDIVYFYNLYSKLMLHWNKEFPGFVTNIVYENLVNNPISEIKNLVKSVDLKWDEKCLKFYENSRPIKTASDTQARTKIYSKSINSWKNYETHLKDFFINLDD